MPSSDVRIIFRADTKKATGNIKKLSGGLKNTGKTVSALTSAMQAMGAVAVFSAGKKLVDLARTQARAEGQLAAALKSTGYAAGLSQMS